MHDNASKSRTDGNNQCALSPQASPLPRHQTPIVTSVDRSEL